MVTLDDTQLEFDFSSPIASARKVSLQRLLQGRLRARVGERPRFESDSTAPGTAGEHLEWITRSTVWFFPFWDGIDS